MEILKMYSANSHLIQELSPEQVTAINKIANTAELFEEMKKDGIITPLMDNFHLDDCIFGTMVPLVRFFVFSYINPADNTFSLIPMVKITNHKEEVYICQLKNFL